MGKAHIFLPRAWPQWYTLSIYAHLETEAYQVIQRLGLGSIQSGSAWLCFLRLEHTSHHCRRGRVRRFAPFQLILLMCIFDVSTEIE